MATTPEYPVPNRTVAITFTKTNATSDYIRVWMTDAPVDSEERQAIEDGGLGRFQFWEGDSGGRKEFVPRKGGIYRLVAQEYTRSATHGGRYENDPEGAPSAVKVGSEYSISLTIGQRMVMDCGAGQDTASLVLFVFGSTIRATSLADHGETTPVVKDGATDRAKMALATTAVKNAARALADVAVSTAVGTVSTILSEMVDEFNDHLTQASVHQNNDTDNDLDGAFASSVTPETFPATVSRLLSAVRQHFTNDNGQGPGTAGLDPASGDTTPNAYHHVSVPVFDLTNMPLFSSVSGTAESYRALADIWRAYESHRVSTAVHDNQDSTNTLTTLPALLTVHKEFFSQLAAISPTVPETQTSGAVQLMTQVGAKES